MEKTVVARLRLEIAEYLANARRAGAATVQMGREIAGVGQAGERDLDRVGKGALLMAGGVVAAAALAGAAAVSWESDWAGVTKTVDGSVAQLAELEEGLRDLATELPATHGEIAAVAEAAGQLGIQRAAIEGFTETMLDLGETTNLTADQAATSMARMANIFQTPQAEIDRMASTLVALGNAGASTESEILEMATRIAGSANQVGIGEAATLGFANALSSVGVEAEAGGTAISRVFSTIASAVAEGGEELEGFARVAGMSADEYARAFEADAAGATVAFIEGLDGIKASGENVFAVLEQLELGDIRVRDALLRAAGAGDLFRESLALGADEWERNNALQTEAAKRYETTAAKLEVARNTVVDLGIDMGDRLLPAITAVADTSSTVVRGFSDIDGAAGTLVGGLALVSATGLGMVGLFGTIGPKVRAFQDSLRTMGSLGTGLANNLGKGTAALGLLGAAVGIYSYVLGRNAERKQEAIDLSKSYAEAIRAETGAIDDNIDAVTARELGDWGGSSQLRDLNADFGVLLTGIRDVGHGLDDLSADTFAGDMPSKFGKGLEEAGLAGTVFGDELVRLHGLMTSTEFDAFLAKLADLGGGYSEGAILAANLAAAETGVGDEADRAAPKLGRMARELGLNAEEAEAARDQFEDLMDSYRASVDPLFGMLDALDKNREAIGAEAAARAEAAKNVADASETVADAERDLNDARASGEASTIASAEERLADARERLAEVQADAAISAEELAGFNRDVAQSALDVTTAARDLAFAVEDGTVSVEQAIAMLQGWVTQGLISEDQAANMAEQFGIAYDQANRLEGDFVANFVANTDEAEAAMDRLYAKVQRLLDTGQALSVDVLQAEKFISPRGAATGALVTAGGVGMRDPQPGDTVPMMLTPGEGVLNTRAMSILGVDGLNALNAGQMFTGGSLGGGGYSASTGGGATVMQSIDNRRSLEASITVPAETRRSARDIVYALEVAEAELGG